MAPAISVIMPAYNGDRYIRDAVESVLAQSFGDFEFLILDDGSTDSSWQILENYAAADNRIRLIQTENSGVTASLNRLLQESRGELLARMDADDISLPNRFERQVAELRSNPNCVVVGCQARLIDADGRALAKRSWPVQHEHIVRDLMRGRTSLPHPGVMMRPDRLRNVGGYDTSLEFAQDVDLWLRLSQEGQLKNLDELLLLYRIHDKQVSFDSYQRQRECARLAVERAYRRQGGSMPASISRSQFPTSKSAVYRKWAKNSLSSGQVALARKHAWASVCRNPLSLLSWYILIKSVLGITRRLWPFPRIEGR